jgi:hypothetical protein
VYNNDNTVHTDICKIFTLPFTPVQDVQDIFDYPESTHADEDLLAYVETTYVKVGFEVFTAVVMKSIIF